MDMLQIIDECESTNAAISRNAPHGFALMALTQTAGRGQRGNSWEAEPGLNITLSLMLRPHDLPAARQFELSEAVALGVVDLLDSLHVGDVAVKWPNDIYVADKKICGILIENSIAGGHVAAAVAGIGLNVNQQTFRSPAPNPVSLRQLTGRDHDIRALARKMLGHILDRMERTDNHTDFRRRLWRGIGSWPWITADGQRFTAEITDLLPSGHIVLGNRPPFAFKEVFPIMEPGC